MSSLWRQSLSNFGLWQLGTIWIHRTVKKDRISDNFLLKLHWIVTIITRLRMSRKLSSNSGQDICLMHTVRLVHDSTIFVRHSGTCRTRSILPQFCHKMSELCRSFFLSYCQLICNEIALPERILMLSLIMVTVLRKLKIYFQTAEASFAETLISWPVVHILEMKR